MTSQPFKEMAERIDHNAPEAFAGAFVIVEPGGEAKQMLLLNPSADPAIFWGAVKTVVDMALSDLAQAQSGQQFGRR